MAEQSQSVLYIGYVVLFFLGLMMLLGMFIPGLTNVETNIDVTHKEEYRKAIVLENLLSLDADTEDTYNYGYTHRRGVIPVEYFSNRDPDSGEIGYYVNNYENDKHCYIKEIGGLDGENFAFGIDPLVDESKGPEGDLGDANEDFKSVVKKGTDGDKRVCADLSQDQKQEAVVSTAMLVRKDKNHKLLPVRLYVYTPGIYIPDVEGAP